jgi:hypothetical protein
MTLNGVEYDLKPCAGCGRRMAIDRLDDNRDVILICPDCVEPEPDMRSDLEPTHTEGLR